MKIVGVYCGGYHSFVQNENGEIFGFGLNLKGQLGIGNYENKKKKTLVYSLLPNGNKNPRSSFLI
jgi:mitogen-activated protein kinase kinase kinase 9